MGIPDHLTRLLRNLYAGQEATVRTGHGPGLMHDIGCLGLVHWDNPEGWYGEGGGRGGSRWGTCVHPWRIYVDVWQNQYNIVISLQLK